MTELLTPTAKTRLAARHMALWLLYGLYLYVMNAIGRRPISPLHIAAYLLLYASVFYTCLFFFNRLQGKKGLWNGLLYFVPAFVLLFGAGYCYTYFLLPSIGIRLYILDHFVLSAYLHNAIKYFGQYAALAALYFFFVRSLAKEKQLRVLQQEKFFLEQETRQRELEKLQYEYAFLRAQINPHFLHNTLNVLFSQALPLSQDLADNILKLSEIMRYALESATSEDAVAHIKDELQHLESLIAIHRLRFSKNLNIDYQLVGEIGEQVLPPLSLITAVENAFKYGDLKDPAMPLTIFVELQANLIRFCCTNKKKKHFIEISSHSIGTDNLSRRLDITFKNKYQLKTENTRDRYCFELTIQN